MPLAMSAPVAPSDMPFRKIKRTVEVLAIGAASMVVRDHLTDSMVLLPFEHLDICEHPLADGPRRGVVIVTMPLWLAADRGIA